MIVNGLSLIDAAPIKNMVLAKTKIHGVSHGISEVGYDLRVKQEVKYFPPDPFRFLNLMMAGNGITESVKKAFFGYTKVTNFINGEVNLITISIGRTALASSIEEFQLPSDLWGELRNKSTHARRFIDATMGTDMEPGWKGFLTIEIMFHGNEPVTLPAGSAIAKAVFHELKNPCEYIGKYNNQADMPVPAILETDNES